MGLTLTTAPQLEPTTLEDIKEMQSVDDIIKDELLRKLQRRARARCERLTSRQFMTATYTYTLPRFPRAHVSVSNFALPRPPLQSVTSINYLDTDGASQLLATSVYGADTSSKTAPGAVYLKDGQSWPSTQFSEPNAVTVVYVAGWATHAEVPLDIRLAVEMLTGHYYCNREAFSDTFMHAVPEGVRMLLNTWKVPIYQWFGGL